MRRGSRAALAVALLVSLWGLAVALPPAAPIAVGRAASDAGAFAFEGHTGGPVRAVIADASRAWVGEGIGITRLDIARRDDVRSLGHHVVGLTSDVWSLAQSGPTLYVGASDGLHVYDVSDPAAPVKAAFLASSGAIRAVTVHAPPGSAAHWLFLADDEAGVRVVEASEPGGLRPVTTLPGSRGCVAPVAIDGTRAVVPADDALVFDISAPASPVALGRVSTSGRVRGVAAAAGWLFAADTADGLLSVPLGGPLSPVSRLGAVRGGRLYLRGPSLYVLEEVGGGATRMRLVDVSDPSAPRDVLGGESTYSVLRDTVDVAPVGDRLVAARTHRLTVADVRDRHWPAVLVDHHVTWPVRQIALGGRCAYAARGEPGMDVVRVAPPDDMRREAAWRPPGGTSGVHVHGSYLYVSDAGGFGRFDASVPCALEPRELPFAPNWGATGSIAMRDDRLVAATLRELYVADLRGDRMPQERSRTAFSDLEGWPATSLGLDVALVGPDVAYVAAGGSGLALVSLANPREPALRRVDRLPEGLEALSLSWAHVGAGPEQVLAVGTTDGVLLYEVTDPHAPRLLGVVLRGMRAVDVVVDEGRLHVAVDLDGLRSFDISDPRRPRLEASLTLPYPVTAVAASGRSVFASGAGLLHLRLLGARPTATATRTSVATAGVTATPTFEPTPTPDPADEGRRVGLPLVLR